MEPIDLAAFRDGQIELIGERKPHDYRGCQHRKHSVDTELRRVTCRDCGEVLDPIEVLVQYAAYWRSVQAELKLLMKLRTEQRQKEQATEDKRMARQVAKGGGVWACDVKTRGWYYDVSRG